MNVFGKSERSWRKAQKRAVSPIIATILLVAITVVLAAVLYVLISGLTHGPGTTPIGSALSLGQPISATKCTGAGAPYATACVAAGDYIYVVPIETSTVTFGSVVLTVKSGSTGLIYSNGAIAQIGFVIADNTNTAQATYTTAATGSMSMPGAGNWAYPGADSASTSLTNLFTFQINMGTTNPAGLGYVLVVSGAGSFSGNVAPVALP
jgi:flagellin-like protein